MKETMQALILDVLDNMSIEYTTAYWSLDRI